MRIVMTDPAIRDLENVIEYIALDNHAAAEKVYRAILAATERLRDFPDIGHPGRLPNPRELSLGSLPYLIVYAVGSDAVTILAVFHGARDLARALREREKEIRR